MAAVSLRTNPGNGTDMQESWKDPLSTITLVDMALALEHPIASEKDHTYAVAKKSTKGKQVSQTDNVCLLQKEKDHNYSFSSKTSALRHKPNARNLQNEPTRSSSEENLSHVPSSASSSRSAHHRTAVDDTSLTTTRKSYYFEKRSQFHAKDDHTYPCSFDWKRRNNTVAVSGAVEIPWTRSEPMAMDDSYLGSHSWPKENMFAPFRIVDETFYNTLPPNYKYDHTYAQGKDETPQEKMNICDDSEWHTPAREIKTTASKHVLITSKSDHNYNKGPCDMATTKNLSGSAGHIRAPKLMLKNNRIDHNYSGFTGTFSAAPLTQPQGSVESLDMDLSQSDTDSCEETEEEERRLAITSGISAWLQLRKDHPYSSI